MEQTLLGNIQCKSVVMCMQVEVQVAYDKCSCRGILYIAYCLHMAYCLLLTAYRVLHDVYCIPASCKSCNSVQLNAIRRTSRALPCPALPCPALPCPALPCPGGQVIKPSDADYTCILLPHL